MDYTGTCVTPTAQHRVCVTRAAPAAICTRMMPQDRHRGGCTRRNWLSRELSWKQSPGRCWARGSAEGLRVREGHAPPPPGGTTPFLPSQVCPRRLWQIQKVDVKSGDSRTLCFFLFLERRPSFRGRRPRSQSFRSRQVLLSRQAPASSLRLSHCKPLGGPFLLLSLFAFFNFFLHAFFFFFPKEEDRGGEPYCRLIEKHFYQVLLNHHAGSQPLLGKLY